MLPGGNARPRSFVFNTENKEQEEADMAGLSTDIHKGMDVYDSKNDHIGKVADVRFGDANPDDPATGVPEGPGGAENPTIVDQFAQALWPTDMPDALRARLEREGYVELDADGILHKDRYILPDQIASVSGDKLVLTVTRDHLVKQP